MKDKRLDEIEVQLTPEQWAIKLADQIREFPSFEDFVKHMLKDSYRESPFTKPFYSLEKQAKETWPRDARREQLRSNELRGEFRSLTQLLTKTMRDVIQMIVANRQRAQLQASKIQVLILEITLVLIYGPEILSESLVASARVPYFLELNDWADRSLELFQELIAHKAAVQTIQEDYFGGHSILPKDTEAALDATIQVVREIIAGFNNYLWDYAERLTKSSEWEQLKLRITRSMELKTDEGDLTDVDTKKSSESESQETGITRYAHLKIDGFLIDVEAVEKCDEALVQSIINRLISDARASGIGYRLEQTGEHRDFFWNHLRAKMGMKS